MSDHSAAFVGLEAWTFSSPDLRLVDRSVDVGLLAEALIYYERVYLNVSNQPQFAELLRWFKQQESLDTFFRFAEEGVLRVYDYSFASAPIRLPDGNYTFMNVQDEQQAEPNSFERRFLAHAAVREVLNGRERERLYRALRDNVIEAKAADFGLGVSAANDELNESQHCDHVLQSFLDEAYPLVGAVPPVVRSRVEFLPDGRRIHWGLDLDEVGRRVGQKIKFHRASPLSAAVVSNRFLWSAASLDCDLYLGRPISALVGSKLSESSARVGGLVDELVERVEFPDIRGLVNQDDLPLRTVMDVRQRATRFRSWLQAEADRDRDAILAYHLEVARESGLAAAGRKVLRLFGVVGGGAVGGVAGAVVGQDPALAGAVGAAAGAGVQFIGDLAARHGEGWRPVVFGDWMRDRVHQ